MSERRFDDSPAPDDERALRAAWLADTPPLPDAKLDAQVRAAVEAELAANEPLHTATVIRPARWQGLRIPLALAATVLLSFGAIRVMFPTVVAPQPVILGRDPVAPPAQSPAENGETPAPAVSPLESAPARASSAKSVAEPPRAARALPAAPSQSGERRRETTSADATRSAAPAMPKALSAAPPPAASAPAEAAPASPAAPAAESALGALHDAPPAAFMKRRAAPAEAVTSKAPVQERADDFGSPAGELARIRAQLDRGDRAAARHALEQWVKANPHIDLPDWARALLSEEARVLP